MNEIAVYCFIGAWCLTVLCVNIYVNERKKIRKWDEEEGKWKQ